jgi:hypothetical protein
VSGSISNVPAPIPVIPVGKRFDPDYRRRRRANRRRSRRLLYFNAVALISNTSIDAKLDAQLQQLGAKKPGLFLVHDSGATRCLLCASSSPLLPYLQNRRRSPPGFVTVGGGRRLPYFEEGELAGVTFTTVKDLKYDLYSAVCAAKRGVRTVIEFDANGANRSHLYDKRSRTVTPLVERGGMLEIPMEGFLTSSPMGLAATVSDSFALAHDVLPSLVGTDADFLVHRRMGHASLRQLRELQRHGAKGVDLCGSMPKWCQSCFTAKHKREPTSKKVQPPPQR